jgi:hypothetical protein
MNWKKVFHLIRVDMKAGRLLRGQRLIKYNVKKSTFYSYLFYAIAIAVGLVVGFLVGYVYNSFLGDAGIQGLFAQYFPSFLLALPTIVLVYTLVFTMLQQIQRSGVKFTRQAPYWLPVTWQEHTLASILAELLGFPLISIAFISSSILVFSLYIGETLLTIGAVVAMIASAFIASSTTEIIRILQVRFIGAVYKSTGRAAVWVRFIGSLIFFIVFYIVYFSITTGTNSLAFIQTIASGQNAFWFVPFVWLGLTLFSLISGLWIQGFAFLLASILLIVGLFLLAVYLNKRFGLYEPPAITISRGVYTPKTGILGKLGFSSVQAALIRKDLKGFTRRRELISIFILPIIFLIIPIMTSLGPATAQNPEPIGLQLFWFVYMTLFPTAIMAISLGSFLTGEEGQSIWRIYMSPISAKDFVKSKFSLMMFFSLIILPITLTAGYLLYQPTFRAIVVLGLESVFLAFSAGSLSLANGIKGADFNEVPRPRMIRPEWSIISLLTCGAVALAVLLPFTPYMISIFAGGPIAAFIDLYVATAISGVLATVLCTIFYKMAVGNARELLKRAEL